MTTAARACGACGAAAPPPFRAPPPELSPDLDMRPGEPTRSTLAAWVQVCADCGAAAPDLALLDRSARVIAATADYRDLRAEPPDAAPFLRWAMLAPSRERAEALLHAAWMADDVGMSAESLRRRAAAAWPSGDPGSELRLIDVLRRAGAFAEAEEHVNALAAMTLDENSRDVLTYQRARITAHDSTRHLLSSALRPPARMPHVAHGRPRVRGFWAGLLGR